MTDSWPGAGQRLAWAIRHLEPMRGSDAMGDTHTVAPSHRASFLSRHWQGLVAVAIWLMLVGGFLGYSLLSGRSPTDTLHALVDLLRTPLGPLLYILLYTLRPLAFFSAVVVNPARRCALGPLWGTLVVITARTCRPPWPS